MGRLGIEADIVMTESVLSKMIDAIDSMLLESPVAGIILSGRIDSDDKGDYYEIIDISESDPIGICIGSQEGGTEPDDDDLFLFKKKMDRGVMIKVDVYARQFSAFVIDDIVKDANILFRE